MEFDFDPNYNKLQVFDSIVFYLGRQALRVANVETNKPWGGFIVIDDESTKQFIDTYFLSQNTDQKDKLSPKILVVEPDKRLSWQYHFRRGKLWRVMASY